MGSTENRRRWTRHAGFRGMRGLNKHGCELISCPFGLLVCKMWTWAGIEKFDHRRLRKKKKSQRRVSGRGPSSLLSKCESGPRLRPRLLRPWFCSVMLRSYDYRRLVPLHFQVSRFFSPMLEFFFFLAQRGRCVQFSLPN